MAMSRGVGVGSIVIGCSLLVLTLMSVVCGCVVMSKMTSSAAVSIGIWGIYFLIPGAFSILAGYKKLSSLLGAALGTHILGFIVAIVGMSLGAAFWAILAQSTCERVTLRGLGSFSPNNVDGHCYCRHKQKVIDYSASCSDLDTIHQVTGTVTIIFGLFAIISLIGSIYGCVGTCCAPREPGVVITTAQQPTTVTMTTQTHPGAYIYNQKPPAYP